MFEMSSSYSFLGLGLGFDTGMVSRVVWLLELPHSLTGLGDDCFAMTSLDSLCDCSALLSRSLRP